MVHLVAVPCWRRPEFLYQTVEALLRSIDASGEEVWLLFSIDQGASPQTRDVIRQLTAERGRVFTREQSTRLVRGVAWNIYNTLSEALELSYRLGVELVHIVEEDVEVAPDYFQFARLAWSKWEPWAVCAGPMLGGLSPNGPPPVDWDQPSSVYLCPHYQSIAVSMPLARVESLLPWFAPDYFRDQVGYCVREFPSSSYGARWTDQAGLIQRVREAEGGLVLYPRAPRARHIGFYGYNREADLPDLGGIPWEQAPLLDRIKAVRSLSIEGANLLDIKGDLIELEGGAGLFVEALYMDITGGCYGTGKEENVGPLPRTGGELPEGPLSPGV